MIREHWREPSFWRWFWQNRAPIGAKVVVGVFACAAFLAVGFVAADRISGASAGVAGATYETTVQQAVTVREHGKTIVKRVPVVRRVMVRPQTVVETRFGTRLVTTPGGIRFVTNKVVKYVPVVRRRVVTVNGKRRTITQTRLVATTTIRTQTNVVTNQQTVVDHTTVTVVNNRTVPVTVTDSETETVVKTVTLPAETVTLPGLTVTETLPITVTLPSLP
jgi:hypothetical protein